MPIDIKMPGFGESITEGTVVAWLKQAGDSVALNEPILEITTDKITAEVPAPAAGILAEILVDEGTTVRVGTVIGRISARVEPETPVRQPDDPAINLELDSFAATDTVKLDVPQRTGPPISPVVAKLAAEHKIDLAQIAGTGIGGRISKQDVLHFLASTSPAPTDSIPAIIATPTHTLPTSHEQELVPLSSMRRAIAEHTSRSVRDIPQVTTIFEIDFGRVVAHREQHKQLFAQQGLHLTYTSYVIQAVAQALRVVPVLGGHYTNTGIVINRRMHIGVAVAIEEGLVVPVVRDADEKNLQGIARMLGDLTERARANRLTPDETQGGIFTISNHGIGGSIIGTPIINQQQAGILGVGAIVKRPVVLEHNGIEAIAIRPISYMSLTFDHRVCDGADADRFLSEVKRVLES
ncbi:MAG: dihydrolipoamide acetyltransferase family protein [Roseiflexaceae bacterium]|nr:dihydrolipoamide acetyltransferase family protein [Roseiflexaceae bacterium]